jgi:hypothetical protein
MRIKRGRFHGKRNCMELLRNYPYRYGTNHDVATFDNRATRPKMPRDLVAPFPPLLQFRRRRAVEHFTRRSLHHIERIGLDQ